MKTNKLASAALAGLFATSVLVASNSFADDAAKSSCAGKDAKKTEKAGCKTSTESKEKHSCKGKNSCKGQEKGEKHSCKGKNSCKTKTESAE